MLYHGSKFKFERFKAPSATGIFRPSEEQRSHHTDVIFLTSDVEIARQYAGPEGYLYIVECPSAIPYDQSGKKRPQTRHDILIASPSDINIVMRLRLAPRKRNQAQDYIIT